MNKNLRLAVFGGGVFLCVAAVVIAVSWAIEMGNPSAIPVAKVAEARAPVLDQKLRQAAEAGDPQAQFKLGSTLFQEPGRSAKNSAEAIKWLQAAADNGNTDAMIFLGRLSRTGVGILQNYSQTSSWIRTAAEKGNPEGMLELGRLYRDGVGVERNMVHAYAWFNRAAAAHNLDAVSEREIIAKILSTEELKEAQKLSFELVRDFGQVGLNETAAGK